MTNASISALFRRIELFAALSGLFFAHNSLKINCFHHWDGLYLMRTPGRVLTRIQICEHVWDYHFDPQTNLVDVYIQRLRRKVDDGHEQKLIETVRGVGYRMANRS